MMRQECRLVLRSTWWCTDRTDGRYVWCSTAIVTCLAFGTSSWWGFRKKRVGRLMELWDRSSFVICIYALAFKFPTNCGWCCSGSACEWGSFNWSKIIILLLPTFIGKHASLRHEHGRLIVCCGGGAWCWSLIWCGKPLIICTTAVVEKGDRFGWCWWGDPNWCGSASIAKVCCWHRLALSAVALRLAIGGEWMRGSFPWQWWWIIFARVWWNCQLRCRAFQWKSWRPSPLVGPLGIIHHCLGPLHVVWMRYRVHWNVCNCVILWTNCGGWICTWWWNCSANRNRAGLRLWPCIWERWGGNTGWRWNIRYWAVIGQSPEWWGHSAMIWTSHQLCSDLVECKCILDVRNTSPPHPWV